MQLLNRLSDGAFLHLCQWQDAMSLGRCLQGWIIFIGEITQAGGQVSNLQRCTRAEGTSTLQAVFQLAHVAWPLIVKHSPERIVADGAVHAGCPRHAFQDVTCQQWNILLALPQWRNTQG